MYHLLTGVLRFQWRPLGNLLIIGLLAFPAVASATLVRMQTSLGIIDVNLYDKATPLTVANFLNYTQSGAYSQSFIHRSIPGFIVQGGGYTWRDTFKEILANPAVQNEFSATRSNLRGTIAMAKLGGDVNSATNQWFFNLANNAANLDNQNGGFTVFGKVLNKGMAVVDAIAALPTANAGGSFTDLPLATSVVKNTVQKSNLVMINKISVAVPAKTNAKNRVFAYLESLYPEKLSPANSLTAGSNVSKTAAGYDYRYYSKTKRYLAIANATVYWGTHLDSTLTPIGSLDSWRAKAVKLGY